MTGRAYLDARILAGDQHAQQILNQAAKRGFLGFNDETGRAYLEARILAGDQHAQQMLTSASISGRLGFPRNMHRTIIVQMPVFWFLCFYNAISGR